MRCLLLILIAFSTVKVSAQTDFQNVKLKPFNFMSAAYGQSEPSIAIDPKNPNNIAAGCILSDYYYTKDGGKTWQSRKMSSTYGVWGDPAILFDTAGRVYYFHLADYKKTSWIDRIVCQSASSVDGKFNDGTFPKPNGTKAQDKHWMVLNPMNNDIYLTWTQFDKYDSELETDSSVILFSRSSDQGKTWTDPKRISFYGGDCIDSDNTVEGAVPAVGPKGEIYVVWSGPKGLVFQVSKDRGKTWLPVEQKIGPQIEGWGKDNTDVFLSVSKDGGKTWSEARKVNQDKTKTHQFFTWVTVDQSTGYLYFVYYDRRNYTDLQTDVYISVSKDGGETFKDYRISDSPFSPDAKNFFGDYLNISAVKGEIRPIYPRMDNGTISLWVTLINVGMLK
ncbi:MAG: glycoside hydrolase [Cryomorphaceae bacterium]|nr:glycoside hydrolase [Cryomorphaceae bacterium]